MKLKHKGEHIEHLMREQRLLVAALESAEQDLSQCRAALAAATIGREAWLAQTNAMHLRLDEIAGLAHKELDL